MTIQVTINFETLTEALDALSKLGSSAAPVLIAPPPEQEKTGGPAPALSTSLPTGSPSAEEQLSADILASTAVTKYAVDNDVVLADVTGSGKGGRIIKTDITAVINARVTPKPEDDDPFALGEGSTPIATKEDVRDALVAYQTALRDKLIDDGEDEEDAKREAMVKARGLLEKLSGASTLGGLKETDYAKIVVAADAAKVKLQ